MRESSMCEERNWRNHAFKLTCRLQIKPSYRVKNVKHWIPGGAVLILAVASLAMLLHGCAQKDSCNIPCFNGACVNNSCNCNTGYEGDSCTIRTTEKFIGEYNAVDSCQSNTYGYIVTVAASTAVPNELIITNFGEYGSTATVVATISGFSFTVPSQSIVSNSITISGSGTIDTVAKKIFVSYIAEDVLSHITDGCSGVWTKQ